MLKIFVAPNPLDKKNIQFDLFENEINTCDVILLDNRKNVLSSNELNLILNIQTYTFSYKKFTRSVVHIPIA